MLVAFDRVGFAYRDSPVLHQVSLSVSSGETVALVGRSGSGKTTILKLINRLLLPTFGKITVDGRDTRDWDGIQLRRRIGYAFQDVGLFPHMTVEQNIAVVPHLEGWPRERTMARVRELLELVGLEPNAFATRRPHQLSGGQRQRVGLARALAVDPPILLMDEPFGALDPVTRLEIRREFRRIQRRLRTTVILVTHDVAEALTLGQRVGVIDEGRLVILDTPAAVASSGDGRVRAMLDTVPIHPVSPRSM